MYLSAEIIFHTATTTPPAAKATVTQVHGCAVLEATTAGHIGEADALITQIPNLWLGIQTADCLPIVLDAAPHAVGLVHAGWRGLVQNICGVTVQEMRSRYQINPANIKVYIGPHISQAHYEVGTEFFHYFDTQYFSGRENLSGQDLSGTQGRHLNLQAIASDLLIQAGVPAAAIHGATACTFSDAAYHSYRRNKTNLRQWSCVRMHATKT